MLNFANMQLAVRLLFVSQFLAASLSATRFLPETCAWHQGQYREQECIAQLEGQENAIRARYKHAFFAASMLIDAHTHQAARNTRAWPALNDMVMRDATTDSLCHQVEQLPYAVGDIEALIKKVDIQDLDGTQDELGRIIQKNRLQDMRRMLDYLYAHMVQTEQYKKEKAAFKIMKKM